MGRKTHIEQPSKKAGNIPTEILGAPIKGLPTTALLFWLNHFTAGTPTRRALLNEIDGRGVLDMGRWAS